MIENSKRSPEKLVFDWLAIVLRRIWVWLLPSLTQRITKFDVSQNWVIRFGSISDAGNTTPRADALKIVDKKKLIGEHRSRVAIQIPRHPHQRQISELRVAMDTYVCMSETAEEAEACLQIDLAEGDWGAYQRWIKREDPESSMVFKSYGTEIVYLRACALAYLGRRAQLHGGVCSRTQPRVLTSAFIAKLEGANRTERFRR